MLASKLSIQYCLFPLSQVFEDDMKEKQGSVYHLVIKNLYLCLASSFIITSKGLLLFLAKHLLENSLKIKRTSSCHIAKKSKDQYKQAFICVF